MNKTTQTIFGISLIVVLFAILVFVGVGKESDTISEINTEEVKETGPKKVSEFNLKNYAGESVTFKDIRNDVVVINFWASWCPFCVNELPDFVELQKEYPELITVVAINRAEPLSVAKEFSNKLGISDDILLLIDSEDSFYKSIGGFSMPETIFLNKKGEILFHKRGPMKLEEMKEIVSPMLKN